MVFGNGIKSLKIRFEISTVLLPADYNDFYEWVPDARNAPQFEQIVLYIHLKRENALGNED